MKKQTSGWFTFKLMRTLLKIVGIVVVLVILFRGTIFRTLVKYKAIGTRTTIVITNQQLIEAIEEKSKDKKVIDIKTIATIANEITTKSLSFTTKQVSNNPNELYNTKQANCIGYAAMYNSIANYLIEQYQLQEDIKVAHKVAQLKILGINIHQFINNPFFKDHDYNELINIRTKQQFNTDPSLNDYFWIDKIVVEE
ncbi:MAG: hypothetical protein R2801_11000 [Chitinophagales bacterium]